MFKRLLAIGFKHWELNDCLFIMKHQRTKNSLGYRVAKYVVINKFGKK